MVTYAYRVPPKYATEFLSTVRRIAESRAIESFRKETGKLGRVIGSQRNGNAIFVAVVPFK